MSNETGDSVAGRGRLTIILTAVLVVFVPVVIFLAVSAAYHYGRVTAREIVVEDGRYTGFASKVDRWIPPRLTRYHKSYLGNDLYEHITTEVDSAGEERTLYFVNGELHRIKRRFGDMTYAKTKKDPDGLFAAWKDGLVDRPDVLRQTRERFSDIFPQ